MDHRDPDEGFATRRQLLVVLTQPPIPPEPPKCPLHDPPPLEHLEPLGIRRRFDPLGEPDPPRRLLDDLQADAEVLTEPAS
jgi:hypothetical protein